MPGWCSAPAFQNRISLKGHRRGPDTSCARLPGHHGCPRATPAPQAPPKAVHALSLSLSLVSPCSAPELGRWACGCEGRKGLRGRRWLQIGADPKCSEQGAVSPGLTVEEPATEPPEPPLGFLGPGATLPGAPSPSSPHSLSAPLSLSWGHFV